jgi:serine/threonine protein kinase
MLVALLAEQMAEGWHKGQRPGAEVFLDRHPELWQAPAAVMDLLYEEICLRHEHAAPIDRQELAQRFPRWQQQLDFLLGCFNTLEAPRSARFPAAGETLGDFKLLSELGQGGSGRVFLATQSSLGDRPVVLKITARRGDEHLSLARLQHTYIVPLLSVVEDPGRNLRALCMPYFGGMTLAAILSELQNRTQESHSGRQFLELLDAARVASPIALPSSHGPESGLLHSASGTEAIAWIGMCLAEALKYAHERKLVHLDVKPSNVLLTADCQPMLLDFHLARTPIPAGDTGLHFGGTTAYMSPEQKQAMTAIKEGQPIAQAIDGRSDIYSLGLVLCEALGGDIAATPPPPLHTRGNRFSIRWKDQISLGLSDIVAKCLCADVRHRYQDAGALAADLYAHLNNLPLRGVRNRSLPERWRKWGRRRRHALPVLGMLAAVLTVTGTAAIMAFVHVANQVGQARTALADGRKLLTAGTHVEAARILENGLSQLDNVPGHAALRDQLAASLDLAARARLADDLHDIADRFRYLYGMEILRLAGTPALEARCREIWEKRYAILQHLGKDLGDDIEKRVQLDLLDLAVLGSDLHARLASGPEKARARQDALRVLDEAETLFGPKAVLHHERQKFAEASGIRPPGRADPIQAEPAAVQPPPTTWENYALGRSLLNAGEPKAALVYLERAVAMQPNGLWANFYYGVCCCRLGRFDDAALAFTTCTAVAPRSAGCLYNRALAFVGLRRTDRALRDLDRALAIDPRLVEAVTLRERLQKQH